MNAVVNAPHFARVLGQEPIIAPLVAETWFPRRLISECFGPSEKFGDALVWMFTDGATKCMLHADAGDSEDIQVRFCAPMGVGPRFYMWASAVLAEVENGDLKPAFAVPGNISVHTHAL